MLRTRERKCGVTVGVVELLEAEISGYRRFAAKSSMDLGGGLICIVGPNAAGKSSFLDALVHMNDDSDFVQDERTRAEGGGAMAPSLRVEFELDGGDREAIASIPEAMEAKTFEVFKDDGRGLAYRVNPMPQRDLQRRSRANRRLGELAKSPWLGWAVEVEQSQHPDLTNIGTLLERGQQISASEEEDLDQAELDQVSELAGRLEAIVNEEHLADGEPLPKKFRRLGETLRELVEHERTAHPHSQAIDGLSGRVPRFLKFAETTRELGAKYDLEGEPDEAVRNLLALAGTSWEEAREVAASADEGQKMVFLEETRDVLGREITEAWSQIPLSVRFYLEGTVLSIMMEMQAKDYIRIDQQSDGLRQFVALRAFVARQQGKPPIILIDEAETHLHYDAQADLVAVLEEQEEVAKVIYTTHSAGCLPRDLGVGVRGIVPIEVEDEDEGKTVLSDHSRIINGFWFEGHGFSPLLIAMGASAFAFASTQKALITEGFTDALLLPSLIREATGAVRLEYQVVPHFANANADEVADFDLIASRFICAADSDQGGRDRAKFLEDNGVKAEQIVFLGEDPRSGLSLEDLIDPGTYLAALNKELGKAKVGLTFPAGKLPAKGRSAMVAKWCEGQSGDDGRPLKVRKPAVIKAVMEQRKTGLLLSAERKEDLVALDKTARERMKEATRRLGVQRV